MNRKYEIKTNRLTLQILFILLILLILISTMAVVGAAFYFLNYFGVLVDEQITGIDFKLLITLVLIGGVLVGIGFTFLVGKWPLRALNGVLNAMTRLASGDFKTRLNVIPFFYRFPFVKEFTDGFNKMAGELENTEILRSDFVSNFSHEFRTPIASVSGFATLLQNEDLSEEQKKEYLNIIAEESQRLADMSTEIMELNRLEKQTILTGESIYPLAEQIRMCILLLERKWTEKQIDLQLEMDEIDLFANEQMMQQVWINLLDNAIKYSDRGGTITINLDRYDGSVHVRITNTGHEIPKEKLKEVFTRFYQVDASHASKGFGLGLAIVRQIVKMHEGSIVADSGNGWTTFEVELPDHVPLTQEEETFPLIQDKKTKKR